MQMMARVRGFLKSGSGSVGVLLGISAVPLMLGAGIAIDYQQASYVRNSLQNAADAAVLFAANETGTNDEIEAKAQNAFALNFDSQFQSMTVTRALDIDVLPGEGGKKFTFTVEADVPTTLMKLAGFSSIPVKARASSQRKAGNIEVALVLDNTGSMARSGRMVSLKQAATDLINKLNPAGAKIAIIPFDTQVNLDGVIGLSNVVDSALNPFDSAVDCTSISDTNDRAACESAVRNTGTAPVGWLTEGIVTTTETTGITSTETIVSTYTYSDGTAVKITKTTELGQPTVVTTDFSPDGGGSWLSAQGPVTSKPNTSITANNNLLLPSGAPWYGCVIDRVQPFDTNSTPPSAGDSRTIYPKAACATSGLQEVLALTKNRTALLAKVAAMLPSGNTNITIGVQWGVEALSPTSPLVNAAPFGSTRHDKHMIVVTDGLNTQNRWTSNGAAIDARTQLACDEAKALGVTIHTIRLQEGNASLLSSCASKPENFYDVTNPPSLRAAFDTILDNITKVTLTE
jgi:Flp pilus assembly protein TadG